ncbi:DUF975 family protein [Ligilactobacillus hayakitensis]|nr:DUF975 family protein [Ligilactobacillus hayakitensis]
MMNLTELRRSARQKLAGNWTWAVIFTVIYSIVTSIIESIFSGKLDLKTTLESGVPPRIYVGLTLSALITGIFSAGAVYTFLDFVEGKREENYFAAVFSGFTKGRFTNTLLTNILVSVFTVLWTLLLVIPGIIKSLAYSQTFYILKDMMQANKDVGLTEAITESRKLMNGHKWEYFLLQLSFLGWIILGVLSLGIGMFWVIPYMETTNAQYYRKLAGNKYLG